MKTGIAAAWLLALACGGVWSCAPREPEPFGSDPIVAVGHGAFIGPDGRELSLDADLIARAQGFYRARLLGEAQDLPGDEVERIHELIHRLVDDEILANALYIDWLLDRVQPEDLAHLTSVNNSLRWYYWLHILQRQRPDGDRWTKGADEEDAKELEGEGVPTILFLKTEAGGEAYRRECREAGVPIPDAMFSSEWQLRGIFDNEFLSPANEAELWLHESDSPAGYCLALPRYPPGGDQAFLLGIICLGTQSNKSCFLDNPRGRTFTRGVEVSINEFVAGVDLVANGQGVCSDCHAGENPYVVHPEKPPFVGLSLLPSGWPDPLVDASWPQNPGPTNLLDAVPSIGKCIDCHRVGSAGRFPDVSTELREYCRTVLTSAAKTPPPTRTMPPFGLDDSQYTAHRDALLAACEAPPTGGGVVVDVDLPDDPGFISPPIVIDPLYQCATRVAVRGAILDAKVELFVNGSAVGSVIARNPTKEEFTVPDLVAGDVVTAVQEFGGVPSTPSASVTVRDHTVDFPSGLPAPEIDPTLIHSCGDIIAVRHVPGAILEVLTNGGDPVMGSTSTGWTAIQPGKRPFDVGDSFTATASLCTEVSPASAAKSAVAAPSTMPAPGFDPATVYAGQELVTVEGIVYGARVSLAEAGFGPLGDFSWPVSWFPDFDVATPMGGPLSAGDQLAAEQRLCVTGPPATTLAADRCEALPAPRIRHPLVGTNYVVVTQSVPGARIRVYDDTGDELGDGSGTVVMLKRTITGTDILTVVQQIGECTSRQGYRVSVRHPSGAQDRPPSDG